MQLIFIIEISEDNYNIAHDRFKIDSVNIVKDHLLQRDIGNFSIY